MTASSGTRGQPSAWSPSVWSTANGMHDSRAAQQARRPSLLARPNHEPAAAQSSALSVSA
eukprot:scaffold94923_cov32-Tisochrysis_lutea.AAC.2